MRSFLVGEWTLVWRKIYFHSDRKVWISRKFSLGAVPTGLNYHHFLQPIQNWLFWSAWLSSCLGSPTPFPFHYVTNFLKIELRALTQLRDVILIVLSTFVVRINFFRNNERKVPKTKELVKPSVDDTPVERRVEYTSTVHFSYERSKWLGSKGCNSSKRIKPTCVVKCSQQVLNNFV